MVQGLYTWGLWPVYIQHGSGCHFIFHRTCFNDTLPQSSTPQTHQFQNMLWIQNCVSIYLPKHYFILDGILI